MKLDSIFTTKNIKIVGLIILLTSIGLLIRELIQFNQLPSMTDKKNEVVDFFKYKEDTISLSYLWILLCLLGFGLIRPNYFGWLIPQTFLIIGLVPFLLLMNLEGISKNNYSFIIVVFIYFIISTILVVLFNKKRFLDFFRVNRNMKLFLYLIIITIVLGYYLTDKYCYLIIK